MEEIKMKKAIAIVLSVVLCVQMLAGLTVSAKASPQNEICNTAWVDDFSTDTISSYKNAGPDTGAWGNWHVADGKLKVRGNEGANWYGTTLLLKDKVYEDFIMEFDADVSAGYGVILRAQDDANTAGSGLNAWHSGDAYAIMHWAPVESYASVQILDFNGNPNGEVLADVGSIGAMTSVHWKIMAVEQDIIISITDNNNSDNKITYTLTNTRYDAGLIGFYNLTKDGVTTFLADNLSVTPINSTLYENDYSNTAIDEWFVAGPDNGAWGKWYVADGKLQVTGNPIANWWGTSILTDVKYDNFVMEFDADVSAGYGVFLRAQDSAAVEGAGLNTWHSGNVYAIMHWAPVESYASVQILDYNGTPDGKVLANAGQIGTMTSAHWKIVAWGNTISIKVTDNNDASNTLSYVLTDNTYGLGHIGFYNLTKEGVTSFKCDNLKVKGYTLPRIEPSRPQDPDAPEIEEPKTEILWSDDMNGDKGENYQAYGLWWNDTVSAMTETDYTGVLGNEGGSGDGITYYYLNDYKFKDLVMEFDVISTAEKAQYGVVFRAGNPGPEADQGNGYTVMYDGNWVFVGKLDGSFQQITSDSSVYAYNPTDNGIEINHWKVVCVGNVIAVYFNESETPAIVVEDSIYTEGSVGFRTFAAENTAKNVVIDNLIVKGTGTCSVVETPKEDEPLPEPSFSIQDPKAEISWSDDMNGDKGGSYTPYGLWWNDTVSTMTNTNYHDVLGNEGGKEDGITYYYLNDYKFKDLVMEFDVISTAEKAQYGVVFRAGNPGDKSDQADGYTVMYDGEWVFVGKLNGKFEQITSENSVYAYNPSENGISLKHWKVVCVGNTIAVYFNGSEIPAIVVEDSTYSVGQVGFRAFAPANAVKNVVIDNFTVKGTGTYTPPKKNAESKPKSNLNTYDFEWVDNFDGDTFTSYLAHGRWWNNAISEFNEQDYKDVLANEGGIADGVCYYYLRKYKWADFTMEFDVNGADKSAQYGVVLRAGNYSANPDDCDGYTVMYDGEWIFVGKLNGEFVQLKSSDSPYSYNPGANGIVPKHWKITCYGDTIQVYLNGSDTPVITVKDSDFECGYVGFRTFAKEGEHTNVIFDNLRIKGSVLVERLTTMINSNRRKGEVKDYSKLSKTAEKTDKVFSDKLEGGSNNENNTLKNLLICGTGIAVLGFGLIGLIFASKKKKR